MAHSVNLLPWRRQHYVARLRLWCVVWGASLLLIASLATIARLVFWQEGRINELLLTAGKRTHDGALRRTYRSCSSVSDSNRRDYNVRPQRELTASLAIYLD
ncbi:PilN family protein [Salmonella enterica subsp. enterica]|uniref:PilN family protein n=1 Tax=Salmonella enterica I TaxID=59201 RepID=A0A447P590_SALET|nr:PilN family protein [Salmonella enterica subsp. enterica]